MLINILWLLTDNGLEELKILQTIILLVTTTDVVKHNLLAKVTWPIFSDKFWMKNIYSLLVWVLNFIFVADINNSFATFGI